MTEKLNQFRLLDFWFNDVSVNFDKLKPISKEETKKIKQKIKREIIKVDQDNAIVKLIFTIEGDSTSPVFVNIVLCGKFECTNWESDEVSKILIRDNATTILFPYLRHAVSDVTTLVGLPPYVLPIVNVAEMFNKQKDSPGK